MGTLFLHFQQLRNGLPSLNVAVRAVKMIHVKDVQEAYISNMIASTSTQYPER
jgi:hypothetical protein